MRFFTLVAEARTMSQAKTVTGVLRVSSMVILVKSVTICTVVTMIV
jgi:hypothetical protein